MRILELHAPYFRAHLRRDHEVLAWGPHPHCDVVATRLVTPLADVLAALPAGWRPDVILIGDDSKPLAVRGLEDAPCPVVLLSVDAHHHAHWHSVLAGACALAFVAQSDYLPAFAAAGGTARWLPLWAPDALPAPAAVARHDVAFIGSLDPRFHPARVRLLEAVRRRLPVHVATGAWADVFAASRIVLNQTVGGDLNARVFEAMGCGAMLLTEHTTNGLLTLFADGEDLVTYPRGDADAFVEVARRWLADEPARARVAARGRERVLAEHCERHRAAAVADTLRALPPMPARAQRHAAVARAHCLLASWAREFGDADPSARAAALQAHAAHLEAAGALALGDVIPEPARSAVVGLVALETGDLRRAQAQLGWVVRNGGGVDDHLALIAAHLRADAPARALDEATALCALHPEFEGGPAVRDELARLVAAA